MFTTTEQVLIEEEFTVVVESAEIIPGVKLSVYDGVEGVLTIGEHDVTFAWSKEASVLFSDIDTCEPIELLALLAKNYNAIANELQVVA
ncbi:hypothetical protein [Psychrobacillus sp. FSL K6-1415]|uniref:hypothetical protein n=1 Tax=Psychrobacillus sp. FSL K6-1415 TaxID=2921544 RepID=UPI0030F99971